LFEDARDHVIHYYHRLLVEDFLPQVIGADRTANLAQQGRKWYFPDGFYDNENSAIQLPWMPIEFSVAAYRFGHSQVRFSYHLNNATQDVPLFSFPTDGSPPSPNMHLMGFTPLADSHVINWRYFFPVGGSESLLQHARKIDTKLPSHLFALDRANVIPQGDLGSLAARNLNRGRVYRLPSGQDIATAMGIAPVSADATTINTLAFGQTPLWYYILQEADHVSTTWNTNYNMILEVPAATSNENAASSSLESIGSTSLESIRGGKGYRPDTTIAALAESTEAASTESTETASIPLTGGNILGPVGGTIVGEVIYGLIDHYRERTGKGLDYNSSISLEETNTGIYGRRIQMQHVLDFAGQLEFDG